MGLISFTKHKRLIYSKDLEVLYAANQLGLNAPESFVNSAGLTPFSTSESGYGKRGRGNQRESNARWNPVTFSSKQQQASWSTSSQARERRKLSPPSSATDFTNFVLHRCKFWDWNTFLSSQVFEQYVGIYEPNAPSFRVFDPRGVTRINFTWQLVKFAPIRVEKKLVKPIKFTLLRHVNHAQ